MAVKQTALHHHHAEAKATWTTRNGWEIPACFSNIEDEVSRSRAGVGVADLSYLQKLQCPRAQPGAFRLTEKKFLVIGDPAAAEPAGAFDVTSIFACFMLAGPRSASVLGKLTSLNLEEKYLPNRTCRQSSFAHVHAAILRDDLRSMSSFKILVARDYGEFVWDSILHAGHEFGIVRMGIDAVDRL
jgi:glycine cleavage system aminomethyltransferase T